MLNQKLNPTPSEDLTIDVDLLYETDPCELKLDEMIEAEPEPEMIEASRPDALTPCRSVSLNCSSMYSQQNCFQTVKRSRTARRRWTRLIS